MLESVKNIVVKAKAWQKMPECLKGPAHDTRQAVSEFTSSPASTDLTHTSVPNLYIADSPILYVASLIHKEAFCLDSLYQQHGEFYFDISPFLSSSSAILCFHLFSCNHTQHITWKKSKRVLLKKWWNILCKYDGFFIKITKKWFSVCILWGIKCIS